MSRNAKRGAYVLLALFGAGAALWYLRPQWIPAPLQQALPTHPVAPALYKYKDDRGQWVVADRPPSDGRPYETVRVDPNTNVVPAGSGIP